MFCIFLPMSSLISSNFIVRWGKLKSRPSRLAIKIGFVKPFLNK